MARIQLRILTPSRMLLEQEVDEVVLPGWDGEFGVLPDHRPLMAALRPGAARCRTGTQETVVYIEGGFAEVLAERVTVLATAAELPAEIDVAKATQARNEAQNQLATLHDPAEFEDVSHRLACAIRQLEVAAKAPPK